MALDHAQIVLAGILPDRRDHLVFALQHLEPEHFRQEPQRKLFQLLERYYDITSYVLPRKQFIDLLEGSSIEPAKVLLYTTLYDEIATMAATVSDHEFKFSVDRLKDQRAQQLTGEAITASFEVLENGLEVERQQLKGHTDARQFLYSELAKIDRLGNSEQAPEGDMREETAQMLEEYADRKSGKLASGIRTGITEYDSVTGGIQPGEMVLICAYTGEGKAARLSTPVLTPDRGWVQMGDLVVGDRIVSRDGGEAFIRSLYPQGEQDIYKVTMSDGAWTECTKDHLWNVQDNNQRSGRTPSRSWSTWPTWALKHALDRTNERRIDLFIPVVDPPIFDEELSRKWASWLHPYVLGSILGDGSFTTSTPTFTSADPESIETLRERLPTGDAIHQLGEIQYSIVGGATAAMLRELGLHGKTAKCKSVPELFFWTSPEDRLELLRGLMDTDGTISPAGNNAEFTSISWQLTQDVVRLVRSLGGIASFAEKLATLVRADGSLYEVPAFRTNIKLKEGLVPFRLPRKVARYIERFAGSRQGHRNEPWRKVISVELVDRDEAQCLRTSAPDGLYVTDDFIVTHNSLECVNLAHHAVVTQGKNLFFATSETIRPQVKRRIAARHSRMPQFNCPGGINSQHLKDGTLTDEHEEVYRAVLDDLRLNPNYGKIYIAQVPRGATLGFVEARLKRVSQSFRVDLVIDDYLALLKSDTKRQTDREDKNEILRDAKVMATSANDGAGVALVSPWAMSQSAFKEARSVTGEYQLANLADTSEAEKSADTILAMLRRPESPHEVQFQMLKNRDGELPPKWLMSVDYRNAYFGPKIDGTEDLLASGSGDPFAGLDL